MDRPISELLKRRGILVFTSPEVSVREAVATMTEHNIGAVAVLTDGRDLAGIFTERDLMHRVVHEGRDPETTAVREVMTDDVVVVSSDTSRSDALNLMREEHFRHLPVAEDGDLVGMISLRDLLRYENEVQQFEIEQLREFVIDKPYPSYPG